ncbi:MAG: hypothetical protein RSF79_16490, partial [Janthinobacterium sp.]
MKRRLLLLSCCLAYSCVQAASECPGFPVLATSGEALLAQVRALPPVGIDRERQACAPATVIDFAYSGGTLCSFGGEVDAATAAVTRLATLSEAGRITDSVVDEEIRRLQRMWQHHGGRSDSPEVDLTGIMG